MGLFDIFKSKDTRPAKYDTQEWFKYAQKQEEKGNWQAAADCYMVIVERAKAHSDAYYHLFVCLEKLRQWDNLEKYARLFDDRLGYLRVDWGKHARSAAFYGRKADEDAANKGKDSKSSSAANAKQAETAVPKHGVVLKTKKVNGIDVKEVTWVDEPEPELIPQPEDKEEPKPEDKEEPKPKVIWPVKAEFKPKPLPEGRMTTGARYDKCCRKLPAYNFFDDEPNIPPKIVEACKEFMKIPEMVRLQVEDWEAKKHYKNAAECCEAMIWQECWEPWPYTKLMQIYKGAGLLKDAEELRIYSIQFFTARRIRMEQQMRRIAGQRDADIQDMVRDMIANGKEIWYYRGLFKLYDPYPCIEEWKEMGDISK